MTDPSELLDACDRCLDGGRLGASFVVPAVVEPAESGGLLCFYLCPECHATWSCWWSA